VKKLYTSLILCSLSLWSVGCQESTKTALIPDISSIEITENSIDLYPIENTTLHATAYFDNNTTADVTDGVIWSTNDATAVSAIAGSIVPYTNGGDYSVSIKYDKFSNTKPLHIHTLTSYTVELPDINATGSYPISALGQFDDDTNRTIQTNIEWIIDNDGSIEVHEDGNNLITLQSGDTNITTILFHDENLTQSRIIHID